MKKYLLFSTILALAACSGGDHDDDFVPPPAPQPPAVANAAFEVEALNLTPGQPLSPIAILIHDDSVQTFSVGQPASEALELLAESGDNSQLLSELEWPAKASGVAPLGPGASESFTLELPGPDTAGMRLTILGMLVNSNDAIAAVNGLAIDTLEVGQSMTLNALSYDTGTEANSETAATIPGPAGGGEGFNPARDDIRDQVTVHGGVVTADDGFTSSSLGQQHRWDHPVAQFRITRTR